ncbi:MAG: SGNH/GDSL hydrolase family protein [Planctomycetaceae bacterium]
MTTPLDRRRFLSVAAVTATAGWSLPLQSLQAADGPQLNWHDVRDWGVEGKGWSETEKYFDRFPAKAKGVVRDAVWNLSRHSAGMLVRFRTDASVIWSEHTVTSRSLDMPHMPSTGVSGLDLYAEDEQGMPRWVAIVKPTGPTTRGEMVSGVAAGERTYSVYLPLYNGTEAVKIGIPTNASFTPLEPRTEKPIVFYGTSITHGACASRTGMPHPAILGRRLNRPVINLGFSGNGKMEPEVGALLAELDPAVYVIDCLPNMVEAEVSERAVPLVHQLNAAHPETPILLVEDRTYANTWILPDKQRRHAASRAALQAAYQQLQQEGIKTLSYLEGDKLLSDDREDTTDGSHPSDLGFFRQADAMEPLLRAALS